MKKEDKSAIEMNKRIISLILLDIKEISDKALEQGLSAETPFEFLRIIINEVETQQEQTGKIIN